jgi:hypothetical protein
VLLFGSFALPLVQFAQCKSRGANPPPCPLKTALNTNRNIEGKTAFIKDQMQSRWFIGPSRSQPPAWFMLSVVSFRRLANG